MRRVVLPDHPGPRSGDRNGDREGKTALDLGSWPPVPRSGSRPTSEQDDLEDGLLARAEGQARGPELSLGHDGALGRSSVSMNMV